MAAATLRHFSNIGIYATYLLAAGLMSRRIMETDQARRCARWSATTRSSIAESSSVGSQHLVVVVPMYQEQQIVGDAVRYWHKLIQTAEVDEVIFVTTVKEDDSGQPTTHTLLAESLVSTQEPRLTLLQCKTATRFRAAQLNLAVNDARGRHCRGGAGAEAVWIGVFNADSRPEGSVFRDLRQCANSRAETRAYQQLVDYVVPDRAGVSLVADGNAVLQTWWTCTHYWARNTRGSASSHWYAATSPFSTFGHGEFIRLDLLDEVGGFPDFAYADGLLLGWILRLMDEQIGLLASKDRAEVPRTARDLLTQQRAWMRGLLNFEATLRWARDTGRLRLTGPEVAVLRCHHMIIPIAWGLSTPAVAAGMAIMIGRFRQGRATLADAACLLALASYPIFPALAGETDDERTSRLIRPIATGSSWVVEGLAFWPALLSDLRMSQTAPKKTPR
jgi:cellulose synthase/poly-beta-1,6-N-acetylglucosamine synthase-like glycosyltransferase